MFSWLTGNLGTILVAIAVIAVCALIVRGMARDRKQGKFVCGGSCGGNCSACHSGCSHHV